MKNSPATAEFIGSDPRFLASAPPFRDIVDCESADELLYEVILSRLRSVMKMYSAQRPVVFMSGGIDSIIVALSLKSLGHNPIVLTVLTDGIDSADRSAEEVSEYFDWEHLVVELKDEELQSAAEKAIIRLEDRTLYQVAAGIPWITAFERLEVEGLRKNPVFSGGGFDRLLGGEYPLSQIDFSDASNERIADYIYSDVKKNMIYDLAIPDFYFRLIGEDEKRFYHTMDCYEAWQATNRFSVGVLFSKREGILYNKACSRRIASALGLPDHLAWVAKAPLQSASGIIAGLARLQAKNKPEDEKQNSLDSERLAQEYVSKLEAAGVKNLG